jgi:hypothetical protein
MKALAEAYTATTTTTPPLPESVTFTTGAFQKTCTCSGERMTTKMPVPLFTGLSCAELFWVLGAGEKVVNRKSCALVSQ